MIDTGACLMVLAGHVLVGAAGDPASVLIGVVTPHDPGVHDEIDAPAVAP